MELTHTILEVRLELNNYIVIMDIIDSQTGKSFHRRPQFHQLPSLEVQAKQVAIEKERINLLAELEANRLNDPEITMDILECYKEILLEFIQRIRQNPEAKYQQEETYITTQYPTSFLTFAKLYQRWLKLSNCRDWEAFKMFAINHKFTGSDD